MVCYWQIAPVYICQSVLVSPTLFSHCCFTLSLCVNGEYFSATVHGFIKADGHSDAWMHFSLGPLYNNLAQCILKSTYLCVLQSSAPRRWVNRAWRRQPRPPLLRSLRGPLFWVLLLQLVNLKAEQMQTQCGWITALSVTLWEKQSASTSLLRWLTNVMEM